MAQYQFIIAGQASELVASAFPDLTLTYVPEPPGTRLDGSFADQAEVLAVVARLDDLGLRLLELRQVPD